MATYEALVTGQLNGSADYSAWFYIRQNGQDPANNRTNFAWELRLVMSGGSAYNNSQDQSWSVTINGSVVATGIFRLLDTQRYLTSRVLATGTTYVGHDGNGFRYGFPSSGYIATGHGSVGSGSSGDAWIDADRIPKAPAKPAAPTFRAATPTTIEYNFFNSPDNGGSAEVGFDHQSATDAAFTQNLKTWGDPGSPGIAETLTPGVTHWIHYRSTNAVGSSPFSDPLVQTTLPATPPGLTVATTPSGTQATLTFTPPGGVTGVAKYTWERRVTGTTTPVTTADSPTAIAVVGELLPGGSYDWRASAWIGGYQSPWSSYQTLVQAKPNVNPGDYFDGNTVDVADLNYQWGPTGAGAPNASISTAVAAVPLGWETSFASGAGTLIRVTAGRYGEYAARVVMTADATAAGQRFGQRAATPYWSDVTPGGTYVGSLSCKLNRSQRVAAEITWLTAAGAILSRSVGTDAVVPAATWARPEVTATAPATAEWAVVRLIDVTGTSWATWKGGDLIDLDGAMITLGEQFPYFDGSTLFDGSYVYEWVDAAAPHASPSKRTPLDLVELDSSAPLLVGGRAILDPSCIPPSPPRPPVIDNVCVTEAGVWRRVYAAIPAAQISDYLDVVPTFEVITLTSNVEQLRIRIYPNPLNVGVAALDLNSWVSEQIISYVPRATTLTLDGVHQRVFAAVGGAEPIAADHLLYGSHSTPATWPVLSCGIDYVISVDLPVDVPQGDSRLLTYLTTRY